jgi:hypothetical protein
MVYRTIVHSLKVVDQGEDIPVAHRYTFQHSNLISDLARISLTAGVSIRCARTMCSRPAMSLLLMTFAA